MKKLLYSVLSLSLLAGVAFSSASCSRDSGSEVTQNENYSGTFVLTQDGIKVTVTNARKSGDDFFEVFFNAESAENPLRTHDRDVEFSISSTTGKTFKGSATIFASKLTGGATFAGRALFRVDANAPLDKTSLKILSITPR